MGDTERVSVEMMHRLQNPFGNSKQQPLSSNNIDVSQVRPPLPHNSQNLQNFGGLDSNNNGIKRSGIPPSHPPISPYSVSPVSRSGSLNFGRGPSHSRSLSQPSFFLNDSLPPLSPSPYQGSASPPNGGEVVNVSNGGLMGNSLHITEGLPPRKLHRRSNSDIPFGFDSLVQLSSPPVSMASTRGRGSLERSSSGGEYPGFVKRESSRDKNHDVNIVDGDSLDDFLSAYINMDSVNAMNSSGADDKTGNENRDDMDSRASSENESGSSSVNESGSSGHRPLATSSGERKRRAVGEAATTTRHYRSVSMDSFMGSMSFGDESPKLPPSPSTGVAQLSLKDTSTGISNGSNLEFGNGEFTEAEMKKIMSNDKLAEVAVADPKRAKRILANRLSAARSKERKLRYISELEHKVQTLQNEATTLSAQLTMLQRDSVGLTNHNNEMKFRLQAMEQQAHLRDALNEALTAEIQRLKIATGEPSAESMSKSFGQQLYVSPQMFQLHQKQQQSCQTNTTLLKQPTHQQDSNSCSGSTSESK